MNEYITVDLEDVEEFINTKLAKLLIDNTTDFNTAAFVLQAAVSALEEAQSSLENN